MESPKNWNEANRNYLMASLRIVQEEIALYQSSQPKQESPQRFLTKIYDQLRTLFSKNRKQLPTNDGLTNANTALENARQELPEPAALDVIANVFKLTPFECKILLLCAGMELDVQFNKKILSLNGGNSTSQPTFSLALAVFKDIHWDAITPMASLRYWHLVELSNGIHITKNTLRIDEQILHYLTGASSFDERLIGIFEPIFEDGKLVSSQELIADNIRQAYSVQSNLSTLPIVHLTGDDKSGKIAIAYAASSALGYRRLYHLSINNFPTTNKEVAELARLWNREAALNAWAVYFDNSVLGLNDKVRLQLITNFIENIQGMFIMGSTELTTEFKRPKIEFKVNKPTPDEQVNRWERNLSETSRNINTELEEVVSQFNLSTKTIDSISLEVASKHFMDKPIEKTALVKDIWRACSASTRPKINELAQRIELVSTWDNLVLPEVQKQALKEIAMQVRHRKTVYRDWGFAKMGVRGLGISALFTGESGTGKTMASEVLANDLQLDLYKIDLSQVVNKYIGETEKNLCRIFDAAEEGGIILLFDESDALFGKRSDVKDSHDRHSNIEVSYLLQRMESYSGLAVLTTNMKSAMDKAFLRRLRFVVNFPFPDMNQRLGIWEGIFPTDMPQEGIDFTKLAKLNIAGGNIRNIALNAAFIAAEEGKPVNMTFLLQAVRGEYNKLEKSLSPNEVVGWL